MVGRGIRTQAAAMAEDKREPVDVRVEDLGGEDPCRYRACSGDRCIDFTVVAEEKDGDRGWGVHIEGLPDPAIVHDVPWESVEEARDAAVVAIQAMLTLEEMQREDMDTTRP